ncbi:hypothetical protein DRE_00424 [Drechslerella stenobrocha 248]|uniref:histone acetyltransferase n=1 Tax=Drechslerella stenobrocha 248 TaxID=1043628 RepID=W7HTM2_9PEZI|nr:hypothetical protein DRE_00424 [Drechslerella stenobrocha 248]
MMASSPLASRLSAALPPSSPPFNIHYVSHPPKPCDPLYAAPYGSKAPRTTLSSHFLALSSSSTSILAYSIEVHIYTTRTRTTLFVSKADSTGFLPKSPPTASKGLASPIRAITTAFLEYLIETTRRSGATTHLTLFARAQDQYIFPNSVRNKGKHVLSDIQLIRWWAKVFDPILSTAAPQKQPKGYILVPGLDRIDLRNVFPSQQWIHGHPYDDPSKPVRQCIPHFEDDPKARFMDELEEQGWKSAANMKQFWELMAFRQECSLGKSVGFLSVLFEAEQESKKSSQSKSREQLHPRERKPSNSENQANPTKKKLRLPPDIHAASTHTIARLLRDPDTQVLLAKRADTLSGRISSFASGKSSVPGDCKFGRVLSRKDYDRLMASLLDSDFEGLKCAKESSEMWIDLAGTENLPVRAVDGECLRTMASDGGEENTNFNVLPVSKGELKDDATGTAAGPNLLQPRRKSKTGTEPVITVLQPRKKEKLQEGGSTIPTATVLQPRQGEPLQETGFDEPKMPVQKVNVLQPRRKASLAIDHNGGTNSSENRPRSNGVMVQGMD